MLRDYFARVDKYYSGFPSRSRGVRNNSVVPILWYDDVRKYIGRLRKWFLKEYGQKIRYYVICEYGTQSFRPHYHLLLFHDSPHARADFRNVRTLPNSTRANPREVCIKLDMADLWLYGDSTTKVTDGNMQEYVSKYLTQHSDFPRVLDKFPQKAFTQSYLVQKTEMRLENYSRLGISKHLQQIMLLTKKVSDALLKPIVTGKQIGRASCRERVLRLV